MLPSNKINLQTIFNKLDKNNDGSVSVDELMWLLAKIGFQVNRDELLELLAGKDTLDYHDFLIFYEELMLEGSLVVEQHSSDTLERDLLESFRVFDINGDGFICSDELKTALSRLGLYNGQDCKNMIGVFDTNSDGLLDFEEFKNMMSRTEQCNC